MRCCSLEWLRHCLRTHITIHWAPISVANWRRGESPHPETRKLKSFSRGPKQTISRVLFSPDGRIQQGRGDHQSRPAVADRLKQSTRKFRASHPQTLSYLILLRIGFAKLPPSPMVLVSSYLTFSPLPPLKVCTSTGWAVSFLLHFP